MAGKRAAGAAEPRAAGAKARAPRTPSLPLQDQPVEGLKGVGLQGAAALHARGVRTAGELLAVLPKRYLDLRHADDWRLVREGTRGAAVALTARVLDARTIGPPSRRGRPGGLAVLLREPGGATQLRAVFFRAQAGTRERATPGATVRVVGVLRAGDRGGVELVHPHLLSPEHRGAAIELLYPSVGSATPRAVARYVRAAALLADRWADPLPGWLAQTPGLPSSADALRSLHMPSSATTRAELLALSEGRSAAHRRLALEELLALAVALEQARRANGPATPFLTGEGALDAVSERLRIEPTAGQREAVRALHAGLASARPLRALLVGDVGSGKTAVAAAASLAVLRGGGAVAWLAPTALVAEQHAGVLTRAFAAEGGPVALLLGSTTKRARGGAERAIAAGAVRAVVGTHALLTEGGLPPNLGLVVIDEQHRFGVAQRLAMVRGRRPSPHLLVVSATPIPRSMALSRYGDLEVVSLAGRPAGRQPVATRVVPSSERAFIVRQLARALEVPAGRAFVVVPRIDASDGGAYTLPGVASWLAQHFGDDRVSTVSGRMSNDEQRAALGAFRRGVTRVLVATTVVEVGLDVPDANLMVVLGAEHFGLAQLHQLRGRVGRGGQRAGCLLVPEGDDEEARARLDEVAACDDGLALAERDLARRGAGEWFGGRQSGVDATVRFAELANDAGLWATARAAAARVLEADPELREHPALAAAIARMFARGALAVAEDAG